MPTLVRFAVPGTAALGALGFVFAFVLYPEVVLLAAWGGLGLLGGVLYLRSPRVGGWLLALGGGLAAAGVLFALAFGGGVPWLLVAFWASAAMLLAGLLAVIEMRDRQARLAAVTVLAVLSLLAVSAVALALYVRMEWSDAERRVLETAPLQVSRSGMRRAPEQYELEAAPFGEWARYWSVSISDVERATEQIVTRLEADGWSVHEGDPYELIADKPGYRMRIYWEQTPFERGGPGKYRPADPDARMWIVSFAAYIDER